MDGMDILRNMRGNDNETNVLILSARVGLNDKIAGLDSGANDYLCKPFALMEVVVRLQALVRRRYQQSSTNLTIGGLVIDQNAHTVMLNNQPISLTAKEFKLLELFANNQTRVLSRTMIEEKLYSWDSEISSNALEVYIHNLRKKLGKSWIKTVHGIGYKLGNGDE